MKVRIEFVPGAKRRIRYLPATAALLESYGQRIVDSANSNLTTNGPSDYRPGYKMSSKAGARKPFGRHRVTVAATTHHAIRHNARHNTLMSALGSA